MSEAMLERVAKASNRYYVSSWRRFGHYAIFDREKKPDIEPISDIERSEGETHKACRLMNARAAVEAMREPTDDMGARMLRARTYFDADPRLTEEEAQEIRISDKLAGNPSKWCKPEWRAAIDAILNEAPETQNPRHPDKDGETK